MYGKYKISIIDTYIKQWTCLTSNSNKYRLQFMYVTWKQSSRFTEGTWNWFYSVLYCYLLSVEFMITSVERLWSWFIADWFEKRHLLRIWEERLKKEYRLLQYWVIYGGFFLVASVGITSLKKIDMDCLKKWKEICLKIFPEKT